ncbi:MAG: hypothetical protein EOP50_06145 [Sphingobacteriales bacterium]|nr:MAG: hypothetical protein EOP50_06145 [Sphingobacteriales bacterium]
MTPAEPMMINCGPHGERISTVVCRHLLEIAEPPAGVVENSDDPDDQQAWCYACEDKYQAEGGMTDAFRDFNNMAIVCVVCYAEIKQRHSFQAQ